MKAAINFDKVTHIKLIRSENTWVDDHRIDIMEHDYVYASKYYEDYEKAELEFARISANMGLKVI